ncbi:MAG TPA: triose-phosphate isomerase, partial [Candidatus Xenobia bacterium]
IKLGAQDVYWENNGAYTGEVSAPMLKDAGCSHCIVGHSERRLKFGETDEAVHKKVKALLEYGITPVVCCGETQREHEEGQTKDVVCAQVSHAFHYLTPDQVKRTVIAYEPIWAIGTGLADTPLNANETMGTIRAALAKDFGQDVADGMRILYGGSVNAQNIDGFMSQPNVDGALVGGASLKADSFLRIMAFQTGVKT